MDFPIAPNIGDIYTNDTHTSWMWTGVVWNLAGGPLDNPVPIDTNSRFGLGSLQSLTTGTYNTAIGYSALSLNNTGESNTGIGSLSLHLNTLGIDNSALGLGSLAANTIGNLNTAVGAGSSTKNISGLSNTTIGASSLGSNTTGDYNIAIGESAGLHQANGTTVLSGIQNSIYIGAKSRGFNDSDSNSIVIGYLAVGAGANTVVLGNSSITDTYLKGNINLVDSKNIAVGVTGGTKIGTASSQKLSVWNKTPIVQPTTGSAASGFTGATGTVVNDASTFDGYTLKVVVKALRDFGILA